MLNTQHIIACIWDFDKTLIQGYMQKPIFDHYHIEETLFWKEVNALPERYHQKGVSISKETAYLNHLLTYVQHGLFKGLNNELLRKLGGQLNFYKGLPEFFSKLKHLIHTHGLYQKHGITLEHYIISTGLAEMIRGSQIAPFTEGIFGCELLEQPLPPGFMTQPEIGFEQKAEVSQIGIIVDNTIKTRFIFEINKGTNYHPEIDVNSWIAPEDRRIPFKNMIYIADGPSDIPIFSVIQANGGKTYAVYEPGNRQELRQNDELRAAKRVDHYGPADYSEGSSTAEWIEMHLLEIGDRIVRDHQQRLHEKINKPPQYLHDKPLSPS